MPIASTDFIAFASSCLSRNDEIGFRNASARAYYGAYHHTVAKLVNGPKDSHKGLIDYLQGVAWSVPMETFSKRDMKALSFILKSLKGQRIISDYDLGADWGLQDAALSIKDANRAVALVDSL